MQGLYAVFGKLELQSEDYRDARNHFKTQLLRHGPAPQRGPALEAPSGVLQVDYSVQPPLKAWVSPAPDESKNHKTQKPAVLFLHGGFAMGESDWNMTKPYQTAGFIVMIPALRGENGQSGDYTMFYDEVKDVLSAAKYLAALPYVDANRIYLAGHSAGGTMALLAAMTTSRFRAAASFSGSPDQMFWAKEEKDLIPYDATNIREFQMRSPLAFATSFKCPSEFTMAIQNVGLRPCHNKPQL